MDDSRSSPRPSRLGSSGSGRSRRSSSSSSTSSGSSGSIRSSARTSPCAARRRSPRPRAKADEPAEAPFHGVPISLKDLDTTAGIRTTFSSHAFASNVPDFDLAHVTRLKAAGFVMLGKTNTPEFGTTAFTDSALNGPCRTPWDLDPERRRLERRRRRRASRPGSARSRRARTAAARSGSPRRAAASSASRPRAGGSRTRRSCPGSGSARRARSPAPWPTPPPISTSSAATSGATRFRPRRPSARSPRRSGSTPAGCASRSRPSRRSTSTSMTPASPPPVTPPTSRSLGHEVEEATPDWGRPRQPHPHSREKRADWGGPA